HSAAQRGHGAGILARLTALGCGGRRRGSPQGSRRHRQDPKVKARCPDSPARTTAPPRQPAELFQQVRSGPALAVGPLTMTNPETRQGRRPLVLVVDDKISIRMLIADLLRSNGYDVVDAANGRLAVDVLDR